LAGVHGGVRTDRAIDSQQGTEPWKAPPRSPLAERLAVIVTHQVIDALVLADRVVEQCPTREVQLCQRAIRART
jgi:hypothetical protein